MSTICPADRVESFAFRLHRDRRRILCTSPNFPGSPYAKWHNYANPRNFLRSLRSVPLLAMQLNTQRNPVDRKSQAAKNEWKQSVKHRDIIGFDFLDWNLRMTESHARTRDESGIFVAGENRMNVTERTSRQTNVPSNRVQTFRVWCFRLWLFRSE